MTSLKVMTVLVVLVPVSKSAQIQLAASRLSTRVQRESAHNIEAVPIRMETENHNMDDVMLCQVYSHCLVHL